MIVAALLARNEAGSDRYLRRCVRNALRFCDAIVAVDDHSTDDTAGLIRATARDVGKPAVVVPAIGESGFWGTDETAVRAQLWDLAQTVAGDDGWVYIFDADHELVEITPKVVQQLCTTTAVTAWAFPLWDCWDTDRQMRVDGYWQAHLHPRPWLVKARPTTDYVPQWVAKTIHCGHIPHNYPLSVGFAPGMAAIRHLSYVDPVARERKVNQYVEVATLTDAERAHALSIADKHPTLVPVPPDQHPRVLIASVVRKPPIVLAGLLKSLRDQVVEDGVTMDIAMICNFAESDAMATESIEFLMQQKDIKVALADAPTGDYGDGAVTRQWTQTAFERIGALKDRLLREAVEGGYSHCWLVDADVMCDPYTLQTLLDNDLPIVSAVYWTNWQLPKPEATSFVHAGPQVWQRGSYSMDSVEMSAEEFRERLIGRARLKVGGLGACTLIRSDAVTKGASFSPFRQNPMGAGGMAEGEDRHFCARATALHLPLYADAWSDIWHAYHPSEYDQVVQRVAQLKDWEHPNRPAFGDLVSVVVEALEPVDDGAGRRMFPAPHYLRGRLGALQVLPEIEEAVASLERREAALVKVRYPAHYPYAGLRGQTRILRVRLLDAKRFRYAPVVDTELFIGGQSQRYKDSVTLTPEQVGAMVSEVSNG